MIKECAEINGIQSPEISEDFGRLTVGAVTVSLKPCDYDFEGEGILAESEIIQFDEKIAGYALRLLLAVNIGFEYTKGCTIGVVQEELNVSTDVQGKTKNESFVTRIVLSKIFSSEIDTSEKLSEQVKLFVELVDSWSVQINSIMRPPETTEKTVPRNGLDNMMMV